MEFSASQLAFCILHILNYSKIDLWWFMFTNSEQPTYWFRIINNFLLWEFVIIYILGVKALIFLHYSWFLLAYIEKYFCNHNCIRHNVYCLGDQFHVFLSYTQQDGLICSQSWSNVFLFFMKHVCFVQLFLQLDFLYGSGL